MHVVSEANRLSFTIQDQYTYCAIIQGPYLGLSILPLHTSYCY
jgi:hypothetical protein